MSATELELYDFSNGLNADALRGFMVWCARNNVSDIHLQGDNHFVVGRYGRLVRASPFRVADDTMALLMDEVFSPELRPQVRGGVPADRAIQLDGDMTGRWGLNRGERIRFRVNLLQGSAGRQDSTIGWTLRVIPSEIPPLETLGLEPELMANLLPAKGVGLWGGITGSGKSTSLASTYRHCLDTDPDRKVTTKEDPIEFILGRPGDVLPPLQSQVGKDIPDFATGIRADLRRAPSVMGVGEMRDLETIEAGIRAGQLGHLLLSTTHIHSPGEVFARLINEFPHESRDAMALSLLGVLQYVVVQTLLRTTDGKRVAVREFILFDYYLREKLAGMPWSKWGQHVDGILRSEKRRIVDQAWQLYRAGRIPESELAMVMSPRQRREFEEGTA
ncbi:plasmid transfer ATPase TraJ [Pantoea dispersa]|uniref:Conjugal transfer protein n=1 Tax=Pantoea dispersa TaxID=59814 RepID=A0A8E1RZT9_9GAMM|nr:plasmid transfer ATPase TraJ [Pantoea dispersa]KTR88279.1 conjugal transfer protein [Pantoea dispersa]KTS20678.1 conjugal transfer protein [Pantoea dispersa]KTS31109.1 conjugal transfer protein [Pantoea dispersa]KTS54206.1 conjugal transfer protein [Pantoea dispersa]KTS59704.1 conjugal transfer protein [Pantoea dispersa]